MIHGSPNGMQISQYVLAEDVSFQFAHAVHQRTNHNDSKLMEVQVHLPHFLTIEFMERFMNVLLYGSVNGGVMSSDLRGRASRLKRLVVLGGIKREQAGRVPLSVWNRLNRVIVSKAFELEEFHWPAHELLEDIGGRCSEDDGDREEFNVQYQVYKHLDLVRRRCALNKAEFWNYETANTKEEKWKLLAKARPLLDQRDDCQWTHRLITTDLQELFQLVEG